MRIYAVSCSPERADRLRSAAAPLGLDIVIVESPKASDPEVVTRGATCFEKKTSYPTGLAATIGHIRAMKQLYDDGAPWGIIIEDDVRFHKRFNETVAKLESSVTDADIVSLGFVNFPTGSLDVLNGVTLIKNVELSNPWGAQCYMITREYAKHLVDTFSGPDLYEPYKGNFVTDWVLFDPILGCRRHTLVLPIAVEDPGEPTIAGSNNKPDLFAVLNRSLYHF
jgi:GR25 family glycosyltransferase involved in LPS biosynthesis